jgi:hypothetical protein
VTADHNGRFGVELGEEIEYVQRQEEESRTEARQLTTLGTAANTATMPAIPMAPEVTRTVKYAMPSGNCNRRYNRFWYVSARNGAMKNY